MPSPETQVPLVGDTDWASRYGIVVCITLKSNSLKILFSRKKYELSHVLAGRSGVKHDELVVGGIDGGVAARVRGGDVRQRDVHLTPVE